MANHFGEVLRQIRKEKKLSLRDVEKITGVSNAYLSQIESGKRNIPTIAVMLRLAKGYGITEEEMVQLSIIDFFEKVKESPKNIVTKEPIFNEKTGETELREVYDPYIHELHEQLNAPQDENSFDTKKYENLSDEGKNQLNDYLNYLVEKEEKNKSK